MTLLRTQNQERFSAMQTPLFRSSMNFLPSLLHFLMEVAQLSGIVPALMLICVDFQPAYTDAFAHLLAPLRTRLETAREQREAVHFLYNDIYSLEGEKLGDSQEEILDWIENAALPVQNARMIHKNFGWVSHAVREGDERKIAILILRHLLESDISHSAEISEKDMEQIIFGTSAELEHFQHISPLAWREIKEGAIALPMLFEGGVHTWLDAVRGEEVEMIGGFHHRCFDEISMLLEAGGISHHLNDELIYYLPEENQV